MRSDEKSHDLDALLSTPLVEIPNNGFSGRVIGQARKQRAIRLAAESILMLVLLGACLAVLPIGAIATTLAAASVRVADSLPLSIAVGAVMLSFLGGELFRQS